MARTLCLYMAFNVLTPWWWCEALLGEPFIIRDEEVAIVWGAFSLLLSVLFMVYYVGFVWRKRCSKTEAALDEQVNAGQAHNQVQSKESELAEV